MFARSIASSVLFAALLAPVSVGATGGDAACYNENKRFAPGSIACIVREDNASRKLARCEIFEGEGQWRILADSCPTAELRLPGLLERLLPEHVPVRASFRQ